MQDPINEIARRQLYDADSMTWSHLDHHTWSCKSEFEFLLIGLTFQHFIKTSAEHVMPLKEDKSEAFEIKPGRSVPVLCQAIFAFVYQGELYTYDATSEMSSNTHSLRGTQDINPLVQHIEQLIREQNLSADNTSASPAAATTCK